MENIAIENSLVNLVPGGIVQVLYDDFFTIIYANNSFYEMVNLSKKVFIDKYEHKIKRVLLKSDWNYVQSAVKKANDNGESFFEITITLPSLKKQKQIFIVRGVFSTKHSNTILNCTILNISREVLARKAQSHAESVLKIALKNSDITVWEWNLVSGICKMNNDSRFVQMEQEVFANIPESFINAGFVNPNSIIPFRKLHEKVKTSTGTIQEDIQLIINNTDAWMRMSYTPAKKAGDRVVSAIGIGRMITQQKMAEIKYNQEMKFQFTDMEDIIAFFEYNMSQNKMISFYNSLNVSVPPNETTTESLNDWIVNLMLQNISYPEDKLKISSTFSKENIIKILNSKEKVANVMYRIKTKNGALIWAKATVRFIENPATHDMSVYGVLKNIDKQTKIELSLRSRAERDPISGFYNQETVAAVVDEMIEKVATPETECAVMIFDIDNYGSLLNTVKYDNCRMALKELAQLIDTKFAGTKVAGRVDGDEFLIFLFDNPSKEKIVKFAEDIRLTISMPYLFHSFSITVSCGIAFLPVKGENYASLVQKAEKALKLAKTKGKNRIEVYKSLDELGSIINTETVNAHKNDAENGASAPDEIDQKDILLKIAFSLSEIDSFENSITSILMAIAKYYKSRDAFLVELDENCKNSAKHYFWSNNGIDRKIENQRMEEIRERVSPLCCSALKNNRFFFIADTDILKATFTKEFEVLQKNSINSFMIVALTKNNLVCGYLGVNNPCWYTGDDNFFQVLGYYISNELEKHRIIQHQEYVLKHDVLTGFFTREMYETYKRRFSADSIISLGLIYCRLQSLKTLNHEYGHVYGDSLILFTVEMINKFFSDCNTYRYSGDSFLILVENTQADSFYSKISDLKCECAKSFENLISVGYSWNDYEINLDDLFIHSSERLVYNKQIIEQNMMQQKNNHHDKALQKLQDEIKAGRYEVFLQPKANCSDGKISGAEALIRYYDAAGKIVRPDNFIHLFETEGLISEIDFYVFEQVYQLLQKWTSKKMRIFPISFNFSRATMMDESLFEKINTLEQKYSVPKKHIEIEMTETLGTIEEDLLIRIGKKISKLGYGLTLDDFGARYSNLSILTSLPFDVLKLDKTLVRDVFFNKRTKVVVQNFLTTCNNLKIHSIAEGVESQEQFNILKDMGCDAVQGYLINKPIPIDEFEKKYLTPLVI